MELLHFFVYVVAALTGLTIWKKHQLARKASKLGCLPPPAVPRYFWDPFSLVTVIKVFRAAASQNLLEYLVEREEAVSKHGGFQARTYLVPDLGLGGQNIATSDPKNLQAVLATQFHDFGLGPHRNGNFAPLLGKCRRGNLHMGPSS